MDQEEFLKERADRENNMTVDFAVAILQKEYLKKLIDNDIKDIKTDAKANGILIKSVQNAIKNLKRILKGTGQDELQEEDYLLEVFQSNSEILQIINDIQSKD